MKASTSKPWMKYYPKELISMLSLPKCSLKEFMMHMQKGLDLVCIDYYGTKITWNEFFQNVESITKSLKSYGIKKGDSCYVMTEYVPEFLYLLLALENLGASVVCRDAEDHLIVEAANTSSANIMFASEFMREDLYQKIITQTHIERIIMIPILSHIRFAPDYIIVNVKSYYNENNIHKPIREGLSEDWNDFISSRAEYTIESDFNSPLLRVYTTGTTGDSKQVIHSASTIIGVLYQMTGYGASNMRTTYWLSIFPPSLVAAVVSMTLLPLVSDKILILDPYVRIEDLDLEIMRVKPNGWALIPCFAEVLINSNRIPDDFDMSFLHQAGIGAEAINNKKLYLFDKLLHEHGSTATTTLGFGMSECGSSVLFPCGKPTFDNCYGIPMPMINVSIFDFKDYNNELDIGEYGEICVATPGQMLGYGGKDAKLTDDIVKKHDDNTVWLHTGDLGYMDDDGSVYVLDRGEHLRYSEDGQKHYLPPIVLENIVCDIEGIKDIFFLNGPDKEHAGYFVPYCFMVVEDGHDFLKLKELVLDTLDEYQRPVEIHQLMERPYFHFKTNRKGLTKEYVK